MESVIIFGAGIAGLSIVGDHYILALNPFATAKILSRTPELAQMEVLRLFKPLIQDGPHTQVSFRVPFSEKIRFPRERVAVVVTDSEFNLTLFAEEQLWMKEANQGKALQDFSMMEIEVWHEWEFSAEGIRPYQPKWVTSTTTHQSMPPQTTPLDNLFLAGAHTRTQAHVWSIEGAVESGRRAAKAIDPRVAVIDQHIPGWVRIISKIDDVFYAVKAPHVIDVTMAMLLFLGVWTLF